MSLKISTNGEGSLSRPPELAEVIVTIRSEGKTMEDSLKTVNAAANPVRDLLHSLRATPEKGSDVKTIPWKEEMTQSTYSQRSMSTISYRPYAEIKFIATFEDFFFLEPCVTRIKAMNNIKDSEIIWKLRPDTQRACSKEVRKMAVRKALEKAGDLAEAVGLTEIEAVHIEEKSEQEGHSVRDKSFQYGARVNPAQHQIHFSSRIDMKCVANAA